MSRPTRVGLMTLLAGLAVLFVYGGIWQVIYL
jgi:hypothetical protein